MTNGTTKPLLWMFMTNDELKEFRRVYDRLYRRNHPEKFKYQSAKAKPYMKEYMKQNGHKYKYIRTVRDNPNVKQGINLNIDYRKERNLYYRIYMRVYNALKSGKPIPESCLKYLADEKPIF